MSTEIKLIHLDIYHLNKKTAEAKLMLEEAYKKCNDLISTMNSSTTFSGQAKLELMAFMDLLKQYHGKFLNENEHCNPTQSAQEAIEKLVTNMQNFYDNSEGYQYLMKVY